MEANTCFYANVCQTTGKNQSFPHRILFTFKSESDLITTPSADMHKTYSLSYPTCFQRIHSKEFVNLSPDILIVYFKFQSAIMILNSDGRKVDCDA